MEDMQEQLVWNCLFQVRRINQSEKDSVTLSQPQRFPNFLWSSTICGWRTVTTYHLVPGKLNLPIYITRSNVWKTRFDI